MGDTRPPPAGVAPGEPDPSMDDILASIRRILSEDEQANPQPPNSTKPVTRPAAPADDVLDLDDTMLVAEPIRQQPPEEAREDTGVMPDTETPTAGLIAPEAQTATANAMGSLRRTIEARATAALGSTPALRGGGPTLEEVVRDELRPMLKTWLDANLPAMVERLVAAEIERLVARSAS